MNEPLEPIAVSRCAAKTADAPKRKRMSRDEREKMIIDGAVCFFAEHGFEGKTRELAAELGITQPLLYRYFPSKEALIERVYDAVYVQRWQPRWETLLVNRDFPLHDRLVRFYQEYARAVYDYVWVRIFMFAGLKGVDINTRYLSIVKDKVLLPICSEVRAHLDLPTLKDVPASEAELELVWNLHGTFFYRAIRTFVYNMPMADDVDGMIAQDVRTFLAAAPQGFADVVENG